MAWISLAIFACFQVNHNLVPPVGGSTCEARSVADSHGELIAFARMDGASSRANASQESDCDLRVIAAVTCAAVQALLAAMRMEEIPIRRS